MARTDTHDNSDEGMPFWVKVFAVIFVLLALLVAGLMLFGSGDHGPGRHMGSGHVRERLPVFGVTSGHHPQVVLVSGRSPAGAGDDDSSAS